MVSHGALALAGAVSFVIGALMLFDPAGEAYQVSIRVALAIAATLALLIGLAVAQGPAGAARQTADRRGRAGGQVGVVRQTLDPEGFVFVHGELWRARTTDGSHPCGRSGSRGERRGRPRPRGQPRRAAASPVSKLPEPWQHPDRARGRCWSCCSSSRRRRSASPASTSAASSSVSAGCAHRPRVPGLFLLIPIIDKMVQVDLRTVTLNVPPQEVITKDNVPVRVNAVAYFRIIDPERAIVQVENFMVATSQIAQTTLRSVLGQHQLDELLSERDKINAILQQIIDEATSPWGVKVSIVEVKDVEIPTGMQRAMARQAEAERERRAKVIAAEGEFQASERLKDAAEVLAQNPMSLQLRYLADHARDELRTHVDADPPAADRADRATPRRRARSRDRRLRAPEAVSLSDADRELSLRRTRSRASGSWQIAPGRARGPTGCRAASRPGVAHPQLRGDARGARALPLLRRPRGPNAAGDVRALRGPRAGHARLDGPRRAEPVPGASNGRRWSCTRRGTSVSVADLTEAELPRSRARGERGRSR